MCSAEDPAKNMETTKITFSIIARATISSKITIASSSFAYLNYRRVNITWASQQAHERQKRKRWVVFCDVYTTSSTTSRGGWLDLRAETPMVRQWRRAASRGSLRWGGRERGISPAPPWRAIAHPISPRSPTQYTPKPTAPLNVCFFLLACYIQKYIGRIRILWRGHSTYGLTVHDPLNLTYQQNFKWIKSSLTSLPSII